jgi:bifunctional UDP-N-acetylglucosamine pyrophosphorylase/glucosamine-1-phosphate N-acetyltransferase
MSKRLIAIIPAWGEGAGFGTIASRLLHPLLGATPLSLAAATARGAGASRILVVLPAGGAETTRVLDECRGLRAEVVVQAKTAGTAGALSAARALLAGDPEASLLVLPALYPLLRAETLRELLTFHRKRRAALTLLSAIVPDPRGFGRVLRGEAGAVRIVPEADADGAVLAFTEVGTGIGLAKAGPLLDVLRRSGRKAAVGARDWQAAAETLYQGGGRVEAFATPRPEEIVPLAARADGARVRAALRDRTNLRLAAAGVTILDPATAWIDLGVRIGCDAVIDPFCVIEGATTIGARTRVGPGCRIRNAIIGEDVDVSASTVIDDAVLESRVSIGPFARLRAGTTLRAGSHVGNFVEMKKADFGRGAKAGHLSYLGDSDIGEDVNIGAGTITCNYDGVHKNRTIIEAGAFIGSGSELVAPVRVGRGAYVAAGSVIVEDVPAEALAIARGRQSVKAGWARERRERIAREKSKTGK